MRIHLDPTDYREPDWLPDVTRNHEVISWGRKNLPADLRLAFLNVAKDLDKGEISLAGWAKISGPDRHGCDAFLEIRYIDGRADPYGAGYGVNTLTDSVQCYVN
jgi:hypothetical protein